VCEITETSHTTEDTGDTEVNPEQKQVYASAASVPSVMESLRVTMNRNTIAAAALVAIGLLILYADVLTKLLSAWRTDDNYSHGFFIVPIAVYLAWERRGQLAAATRRPSALGLLVVLASTVVLAAGVLGSELFLTRVSLIGVLGGIVLFMFGWQHLRILAFPLLFLLLMIPLPAIIFNKIAFPLQLLASRTGEYALSSVDIPVLREGNVLILANTSLEVAEACSGIRSLVSLLTLGIVFGYLADSRGWVRTAVALSTIPVAIVSNGARVAGTGIAAHRFGPAAAQGFFHEFSGWAVFVVAFVLMLVVQRAIVWVFPPAPPRSAEAAAT
jgi:exosortase